MNRSLKYMPLTNDPKETRFTLVNFSKKYPYNSIKRGWKPIVGSTQGQILKYNS